jgi:UDP-N-acetylglucosamine:LPS N-acetylglucosamine transferase
MNKHNAYVVAVDMGYGHQRAAYPLRGLAKENKIINANNYRGIPAADRAVWQQSRKVYEFFSRFKNLPVVGEIAWDIFDKFQAIEPLYPKRDLSAPTIQLKSTYSLIQKKNWGKHLIDKLGQKPAPLIATFFIPAFMAEIFNYPEEIYCLCTDTDVSRAWAPLNAHRSRIKYLVPNHRVEERLQMYGVKQENIFVTGFPLPGELIGANKTALRRELGYRLFNLDPKKSYLEKYRDTIIRHLGEKNYPRQRHHPLTLTFAVGGAGAQRELGVEIVKSLRKKIKAKKINVILVAGIHNDVNQYFRNEVCCLGLRPELKNNQIKIIFGVDKQDYFRKFNHALKHTDILWTKPSELSFYSALGLPIIMAPPIGSQEKFNQKWLRAIGAGVNQEDPRYTDQWLFDWLASGWFAEAGLNGLLEGSTCGVENIKKILAHRGEELTVIKKFLHY